MLPLVSFVVVGAVTAAAVRRAKRAGRATVQGGTTVRRHGARPNRAGEAPGSFRIVEQTVLPEKAVVLAIDEVPLDNRFGNQPFVSEHDFSRSAKVSVEVALGKQWQAASDLVLPFSLKAALRHQLARKAGVEIGAHISRSVRIRFTAAPGEKVLYRVVWKQGAQRGLFKVKVERRVHTVPYMVTYGLSHEIQSVAVEA